MSGWSSSRVPYLEPLRLWRNYASDPVRLIVVLLTTFILSYGARFENSSPFMLLIFAPIVGGVLTLIEIMAVLLVLLEIVRRLLIGDWYMERSPISRPVLWLGIVACFIPYMRMILSEGTFRIPFELFHLPLMIIMFFAWLLVFRREELPAMVWIVLVGGFYKAIEAFAVYLSVGLVWGLLTGWRDGMLLALMFVGILLAYVIKPGADRVYARMRVVIFACSPLAILGFIGSLRRSYMLGVVVTCVVLFFLLNRNERRAVWRISPLFAILIVASMVILNAGEFVKRFDAVSDPSSEGSTAYRVFELYNVSQMIREKPIFGWPMGIPYKNYTVLDLPPISSVVTHDVYVYVLWRSGIIGLIFWIAMLTAIIRMHFRTIRAAGTPFERFTAFWLATSSLLVVVSGFFTPVAADHLQLLYPFLLVMASYLPGAWSQRMLSRLPRNLACISVDAPTS